MSASTASGTTMKAGWGTYAAVVVVTLVSVFPLYYTIVMASHTNAEMAAVVPTSGACPASTVCMPIRNVCESTPAASTAVAIRPVRWSCRAKWIA